MILYSYQKCLTCRNAANWLDQKEINYEIIDIVKNPPSKKILELALIQFQANKKKIFNKRGKSYKSINVNLKEISNEKIIELLSKDGKLIKRPFLITNERKIILGFDESLYSKLFI